MQKDGASNAALESVRMTPEVKKKIVTEFSQKQKNKMQIEEETSLNPSATPDTQPLLSGDADEEMRLAPQLAQQKEHTIEGKAKRLGPGEGLADQLIKQPPEEFKGNTSTTNSDM